MTITRDYSNAEKKVILQTLWEQKKLSLHCEAVRKTSEKLGIPEQDIDCIYVDAPMRDGSDL